MRKWIMKIELPEIIERNNFYLNKYIDTEGYFLSSALQYVFTDSEVRQMQKEHDLTQFTKVLVEE